MGKERKNLEKCFLVTKKVSFCEERWITVGKNEWKGLEKDREGTNKRREKEIRKRERVRCG